MDEPERWKQYDDKYWVSDLGRVKHVYKNSEHYLTPKRRDNMCRSLRVKMNNKYVTLRRLIWETFVGKIPDGYSVINKNGCYTMNELYNLELKPMSQCIQAKAKSVGKRVINIDTGRVYASTRDAGRKLKISHTTVQDYCNNRILDKQFNLEYYDEKKKYKNMIRVSK